ncbi:MAG TPA: PDZ domain-containing protein [Actinomycetota bacterium]|nr:PDZ domain-containing protein [Actinomycetota bacterium]
MQANDWDLPPPPVAPVADRSPWRLVIAMAIAAALVVGAFMVPIPVFFLYVPGPVRDVEKLVHVDDAKTYSSEGQLFLTTVNIKPSVTFVDLIKAGLDPHMDVVMKEDVTQGMTLREVREQAKADMRESKQAARQTAFAALGLPAGEGARVVETVADSPAASLLREGDRIVGLDGRDMSTACDVQQAIAKRQPGDVVRMTLFRDGERQTIPIETVDHPAQAGSAFVGISMADVVGKSLGVQFETGEIGGPSAGLMFSLALYDQLTPDDLTHGRKIAGTGAIYCGGIVGPIGGIEEKVASAEREGAEIFLAPELNFDAARDAAGEIEVVSVGTFDDAVEYLESL